MKLNNYAPTEPEFWTGRVDDPDDVDSFRMHQVIQLIDLHELKTDGIQLTAFAVCFIGFCCDEGIRRNLGRTGAALGPEYIRKEFANLPVTFGRSMALYDAGDISCINNNMEEAQAQLAIAVQMILENKLFPIVLGGGHEVAFGHYNGIINSIENTAKKARLGIINFDAHFDLRPYDTKGSSGTMFAQIADDCLLKGREFAYMCLGIQTSGNTISLFKRADELGVNYVLAKNMIEPEFETISTKISSFINNHEHIYVTVCSDVFSSAFAPGVSATQPFGMNPEVLLVFLKKIIKTGKVISFDIAEVSPRFDQDHYTAKLVAIIIYALINVLVENEKK